MTLVQKFRIRCRSVVVVPHEWSPVYFPSLITAVGKSTLARILQSACTDWEVVAEPLSKWQNLVVTSAKVVNSSWRLDWTCSSHWTWTWPPPSLHVVFVRTRAHSRPPPSATCCRWCTRTPSAGPTPFRPTPAWAGWGHSCCLLLHTYSTPTLRLSRCTSVLSTATGKRAQIGAVLLQYEERLW